jgi:hypothetical protein
MRSAEFTCADFPRQQSVVTVRFSLGRDVLVNTTPLIIKLDYFDLYYRFFRETQVL